MQKKKFTLLFLLFIAPLLFYIFLSKGIYHYANLPILTENVFDISGEESFKDHYSIVSFIGDDIEKSKNKLFNLNEVIYKRFHGKKYFQSVVIVPFELREDIQELKERLGTYADASKWKFVFMAKEDIVSVFNSFDTPFIINDDFSSDYVFIVDRELRLRGRKDDDDSVDGKLYGYNMNSVAELKNKMRDDIEIIYYQLKKSMEKEKRYKRKV